MGIPGLVLGRYFLVEYLDPLGVTLPDSPSEIPFLLASRVTQPQSGYESRQDSLNSGHQA